MASLKGTRTEKNILTAFCGESQARNRYSYFASQAKRDGYIQIQHIFAETADQEMEHAKRLFKLLEGGEVEINGVFPAGVIGTTAENLQEAAAGESHEHGIMYPGFAEVAREEGFANIADIFTAIANAEKHHEMRFRKLLANVQSGQVFRRNERVTWRCRNCGYLYEDVEAPEVCPACAHARAHFELLCENW